MGRRQPALPDAGRSQDRHGRGNVDEPRRRSRRERDRLRPAGRHLLRGDRRRRGARPDLRRPVGHAAALLTRRQADRVHFRPRGRRQHLGHEPRRLVPHAGQQGILSTDQQPRVDARRRLHRRAQALLRNAFARRGRDLALPPHRGRRRADDQAADRAEGHGGARLLARRALPLLQHGHHAGPDLPVQQGPQRRDLRDPATRPEDRPHRPVRLGLRRLDPSDSFARRQVARLRASPAVEDGALRQGPRLGP